MREKEAEPFASFLTPMLEYYPLKRGTAQQMLHHKWLKLPPNYDYKMTEQEYLDFMAKKQQAQAEVVETGHDAYMDSDENDADDESDFEYESDKAEDDSWFDEPH